jgi:CheY-like chemotaxis protein
VSDETKGRILVIDDDEAVRGAQLRILEGAGFDVRATHSAFSFLDSAGEWAPDLIMLDIAMPGVSGFDALKTLRSKPLTQAAIIVAFSGFVTKEDETRLKRIGFDAALPKPVQRDVLVERLAALLRTRRSA